MLKKLVENTWLQVILVAAVAFFTFLPTLENFFYLDEWGNLYEWTHNYPYQYSIFTAHFFRLLFDTFHLNATGYFATGLLAYIVSAIIFYLFAARLLKSNPLGLIAGLLYATSPVGITTTTMVWTYIAEGGYPLNIMLLILLYIFLVYIQKKKVLHLLLLFFLFMLFLELMPRRAFMFLPILVLFDFLLTFKKRIISIGLLSRTVALFAIFITYYKFDVSLTKIYFTGRISFLESISSFDWQTKLDVAKDSFSDPRPLITLTNILLAGPWVFIRQSLTGYVDLADFDHVRFVVIGTLGATLALVFLAMKVKGEWGRLLLFALGWIHINILGIYIFSSPGVSDATHRTLSMASPGYALFITLAGLVLYTFFAKRSYLKPQTLKRAFLFAFLVVLTSNFLATRDNFEKFNAFHSRPARAFFNDLKHFYPTLPPNPIIYIDTPNVAKIKYILSRIYGGSNYGSGATLAVFYPEVNKEETEVLRDFMLVEKSVNKDPAKIDRVFAFYYDKNGLSDITSNIRAQLKNKK